jgi:hypothetical protein
LSELAFPEPFRTIINCDGSNCTSRLERSEEELITVKTIFGVLATVVGVMALYVAVKLIPIYIAYTLFSDDLRIHAGLLSAQGNSDDKLRNAFYRDAEQRQIPINPANIKFDVDPTSLRIKRVTADYDVPVDLYFFQPTLHLHPHYPKDERDRPITYRLLATTAGFVLGLFWFLKGMAIFHRYRVVADTPVTPIRSMAMGLVQIRGKAVGTNTLLSPVSNTPCFLYRVNIENWEGNSSGSGVWAPHFSDVGWVPFFLEDETGKVLVNPRDAKYDLEQTAQVEVAKSPGMLTGAAWENEDPPSGRAGVSASSSELRRYVSRVASGTRTALFQGTDLALPSLVGSQQKKSPVAPGVLAVPLALLLFRKTNPLGAASSASPGNYRLTEQCILPDSLYEVIGTCTENQNAQTELERQVIAKGENAPTLLISSRSEAGLKENLRGAALRHILGGGLLAIGSAAALLETLGYLW